jgi:hypothetical protein
VRTCGSLFGWRAAAAALLPIVDPAARFHPVADAMKSIQNERGEKKPDNDH